MNIFHVLSQGKSRLHEPSMSAMLGYLLDSNKDHGLGDAFVRVFLNLLDKERFKSILEMDFVDAQVSLEEPYELNGSRKDIDIQLTILGEKRQEIHRIIIENKIKVGAANPKQLNDYYKAVIEDEPRIKNFSTVFVTPNVENNLLSAEYENLHLQDCLHKKYWIYWASGGNCITDLLTSLLAQEMSGDINPINEYMRHTIKAFIRHSKMTTEPTIRKSIRVGEDIGEVIKEALISTSSGAYKVVLRDSLQIQVFNQDSGDKEIARKILAEYIDENALLINHSNLNTRAIGRKFFELIDKSNY
ncbi:PD-(D/E)XK nuclease family protein [Pseudoalteromonas sp. SG41-1]|uniref:PD-(D/E)XK nuclease family protein n=1 Tax=Pseudoalteromonas sp. SG41-1 TaxID=2760979 RepID=UPI001600EA0E|nr:PD-(D/E)XK nuclease family protein [Pseudoalteromonas sp. SG41-1]MBB1504805.1 PD-(D/E)XK nuclease family protein [Pseudoalteromonas sp. SG41-1]